MAPLLKATALHASPFWGSSGWKQSFDPALFRSGGLCEPCVSLCVVAGTCSSLQCSTQTTSQPSPALQPTPASRLPSQGSRRNSPLSPPLRTQLSKVPSSLSPQGPCMFHQLPVSGSFLQTSASPSSSGETLFSYFPPPQSTTDLSGHKSSYFKFCSPLTIIITSSTIKRFKAEIGFVFAPFYPWSLFWHIKVLTTCFLNKHRKELKICSHFTSL